MGVDFIEIKPENITSNNSLIEVRTRKTSQRITIPLHKSVRSILKKYNKQPEDKRIIKLKDVKRLEYLYGLMSEKQKTKAEPFPNCPPPPPAPPIVKKGEVSDIPPPPAPPKPKSPIDHVIHMAKKGATFYYNGKKVSSDKAIELLKNNKDLNISSKTNDGVSVVKIQTEPITIPH